MRYCFYDYTFDEARYELRREGELVSVKPKVFQVLAYLLQHRERVVSKDELLDQCWPDTFVSELALTRCLTRLRRTIQPDRTAPPVIKTVHKQGYRFIAPLTLFPTEDIADPTVAARPRPSSRAPSSVDGTPRELFGDRKQWGDGPPVWVRDTSSVSLNRSGLPFVGRRKHLAHCESALDEALAGHPNLLFVQGEAGVGKTRLVTRIQDVAKCRGMQVYMGRCSEDLPLPYLPFVSAMRVLLMQLSTDLAPALEVDVAFIRVVPQ